jgi:hypothetical protein
VRASSAGDPLPDEDARPWRIRLDPTNEADKNPDHDLSWNNKDSRDPDADLLELCFILGENPEKEKELSRYQKLRLRKYLSARRPPRSSDD